MDDIPENPRTAFLNEFQASGLNAVVIGLDDRAWCMVFSLMFLHFRLMFPDRKMSDIADMMLRTDRNFMAYEVRSYAAHIVRTLKHIPLLMPQIADIDFREPVNDDNPMIDMHELKQTLKRHLGTPL
jgi:hypothetical protein